MKKEKFYYLNSALTLDVYIVDKIEDGIVYAHSEILPEMKVQVEESKFDTIDHTVFWNKGMAEEVRELCKKEEEEKSWERVLEDIFNSTTPTLNDVLKSGEIIKERFIKCEDKFDRNEVRIISIRIALYKMANGDYYIVAIGEKEKGPSECLKFSEAWISDRNSFGIKK